MKQKPANKKNKAQPKPAIKFQPSTSPPPQHKKTNESHLIDAIFKQAKRKNIVKKQQATESNMEERKQKQLRLKLKKQWKVEQQLRQASAEAELNTQKIAGGLKIYSEEQLNIGKGGNSKLCPFDCNCCF